MKPVLPGILIFVLIAIISFGGLVVYVRAQQRGYAQLEDTHDLEQRIAGMAGNYLSRRGKAGFIIGVVQGGKQHIQGFGKRGETNLTPPDARTVYEIGSISKVFTAIALAHAAEYGLVRLDEPIAPHLPKGITLPEGNARSITYAHLATHSAGLPRLPKNFFAVVGNAPNPYIRYKTENLYDALRNVEAKEPGKKADYSNLGFGLLGHLLELRSGKTYEAFLREKVILPLNLTDTTIQLSPEQHARLIPCFDAKGRRVENWDFAVMAGAGAFRSTAEDMLKFLQANLDPDESPLGKALRKCQQRHFKELPGGARLGWQLSDTSEGLRILWHNGGTAGFYSFIGLDPKHKTAVVLLSNYGDAFSGDHSIDSMGLEILKLASKVSLQR